MHESYSDILALTDQQPTWWTQSGVPRFCPFEPDRSSNPYADEVLLVEAECQECGWRFLGEVCSSAAEAAMAGQPYRPLSDRIAAYVADPNPCWFPAQYGDPPCHAGAYRECLGGDTMYTVNERVVEFWRRNPATFEWERLPQYEVTEREATPVKEQA